MAVQTVVAPADDPAASVVEVALELLSAESGGGGSGWSSHRLNTKKTLKQVQTTNGKAKHISQPSTAACKSMIQQVRCVRFEIASSLASYAHDKLHP